MQRNLYIFFSSLLMVFIISSCRDEDFEFGTVEAPSDLQLQITIEGVDASNPNGDGSGLVNIQATANNAISYKVLFGDGLEEVTTTGTIEHRYLQTGVNTYLVTVVANGRGGVATSSSQEITVFSSFEDPVTFQALTGGDGNSKTWYWAAVEPGHLGVGPNDGGDNSAVPSFYAAVPFEKDQADEALCLYMDEMTFRAEGSNIFYTHNNKGQTYFNAGYEFVVGGSAGFDFCYDFNTEGEKLVSLAPSSSGLPSSLTTGTTLNFADGGFMSYYIGATTYEILSITDERMVVRALQANNDFLAWYHTFTTVPPSEQAAGGGGDTLDVIYDQLIFSDEFDVAGAPDPTFWTYDIGRGQDGWGNQELQYYTDRPENVIVSDGTLKITALREDFQSAQYTSTRLKSQGLFNFTYGRVDIRAKVPEVGGTWPALWMLGEDFPTVGWPATGEMDIMEHVGNNANVIQAAVHSPSSFGDTQNKDEIRIDDATTEFHVYSLNWSPQQLTFMVDDEIYYIYNPDVKDADTWPFVDDFFLIMNLAIGGTLGGEVDPAFSEALFEVDYVRVYQ